MLTKLIDLRAFCWTQLMIMTLCFVGKELNAAVPQLINAQGKLTTSSGNPVPDNTYSIIFTIYDAPIGGNVIWTETNPSISVSNSQFNVLLGSVIPISDAVFSGVDRYLAIKIGIDPEMTPRSRLVSVAYSQRVGTVDNASGGTIWGGTHVLEPGTQRSGNDSSTVSVGTTGDKVALNVHNQNADNNTVSPYLLLTGGYTQFSGVALRAIQSSRALYGKKSLVFYAGWDGNKDIESLPELLPRMIIDELGQVGINDLSPAFKLQIDEPEAEVALALNRPNGNNNSDSPYLLLSSGYKRYSGAAIRAVNTEAWGKKGLAFYAGWDGDLDEPSLPMLKERLRILANGNVGIGTTTPQSQLDVAGTTTTEVLAITGGKDLAEPFDVSEGTVLEPGSVVIIDEANPGKLKLSSEPYDTRVAGVVSGAGNLKPGLTLKQEGVSEGTHNIALSGTVYVLATAANGAIKPGDLLTTSVVPGHVMRATDRSLAYGAVIGKAMSRLDSGDGLVMVLVNLQ